MYISGSATFTTNDIICFKSFLWYWFKISSALPVGHGRTGVDPETAITIFRTYVLPVLTYGLEDLLPTGKALDILNQYHKKLLKQISAEFLLNLCTPICVDFSTTGIG
jgi:hypothetical protein